MRIPDGQYLAAYPAQVVFSEAFRYCGTTVFAGLYGDCAAMDFPESRPHAPILPLSRLLDGKPCCSSLESPMDV